MSRYVGCASFSRGSVSCSRKMLDNVAASEIIATAKHGRKNGLHTQAAIEIRKRELSRELRQYLESFGMRNLMTPCEDAKQQDHMSAVSLQEPHLGFVHVNS